MTRPKGKLTPRGVRRITIGILSDGIFLIDSGKRRHDAECMVDGAFLCGFPMALLRQQSLTPEARKIADSLVVQSRLVVSLRSIKSTAKVIKGIAWRPGGRAQAERRAWRVRSTSKRLIKVLKARKQRRGVAGLNPPSPVRIEDLARSAVDVDHALRGRGHDLSQRVLSAVLTTVLKAWTDYYKRLRTLIAVQPPIESRSGRGSSGFEALRTLIATKSPIDRYQRRSPSPASLLKAFGRVEKAVNGDRFMLEVIGLGYHAKVLRWAFEPLAKKSLLARRSGGS